MRSALGRRGGPRLTCVTYHHFSAAPCEATRHLRITTHPDRFARQLDYYVRRYTVIDLEQLLAGEMPERALLITIDDAYRSVAEIAAPLLAERRLPAVLFANPAPIRSTFVPLDNLLSLAVSRHAPKAIVQALATTCLSDSERVRVSAGAASGLSLDEMVRVRHAILALLAADEATLHRELRLFLEPADLTTLRRAGIEIANHTMTHSSCHRLSAADLQVEIVEAKAELEAMSGRPVRAFAFPWGHEGDATPAAMAAIRASGHAATFLMHGRRNTRRPAPDIWYRTLVRDQAGLALATTVRLKPLLRSIRQATAHAVRRGNRSPAG